MCKREITVISCPGGRFNKSVLYIAKDVGYKVLCISKPGIEQTISGFHILGRSLVCSGTDLQTFAKIISMNKTYIFRKRLECRLKDTIKKVVGNSSYH